MTSELSRFAARLREVIRSYPATGTFAGDFECLALELFALQYANNTPYRRLCDARGVSPQTIDEWTLVPSVPTSAFKDFDVSCLSPEQRTATFHSSGTTVHRPSRHYHCAESLAVYEESLWCWFRLQFLLSSPLACRAEASGEGGSSLPFPPHMLFLTPPPSQAPRSSLVHMFETIRQRLSFPASAFFGETISDGSWRLDFAAVARALNCVCDSDQPALVLGTAFSFVQLLDHLAEQGRRIDLPAGSRVMETGGYKGQSRAIPKGELRAMITERLGVMPDNIISEYGMSELSSQAYADPQFKFPPWARWQIVSPETSREASEGEPGLIRIFDLANVASVLAVQTEDLGVRHAYGFELLGRAAQSEPRGCSLMAT